MTPAARAREAALSVEAKKHALRQQQDGCWIMTLRVHQNDMPEAIMKAAMGTRYQLAMVEIGDDEQPVSRPVSQAEKQPEPAAPTAKPARADKEKRSFGEMQPSQQAGILCGERLFRLFLAEKFPQVWTITNRDPASAVREICKVNSRADIRSDNADWSALVLSYRLWKNHPEYAA
jgi:hypothetical protein